MDNCTKDLNGQHFIQEGIQIGNSQTSQVVLVATNRPINAGDIRDSGLIPGLGRFSGGVHGNPLQYPCLENLMVRGAWRAKAHMVTKSQTRLKQFSTHAN